jgi:SAM-dependent methyltransferase
MNDRSKFAGGDQTYLRDEQYASGDRLSIRAGLHARYRTAPQTWFDWMHHRLDLRGGERVLECGCGTGWLWTDSTSPPPKTIVLTVTDLSPGMVEAAMTRILTSERIDAVEGQVADLQHLPFEDESFDIVVANHMMYHVPDPQAGAAELARVVAANGRVVVATNGSRHMRELWALRAEVFGTAETDSTLDVFSAEVGFAVLRDRFATVSWYQNEDELLCTDRRDVIAYICSTPPGEDATAEELDHLQRIVDIAFDSGDGTMRITKDSGCFVCSGPLKISR